MDVWQNKAGARSMDQLDFFHSVADRPKSKEDCAIRSPLTAMQKSLPGSPTWNSTALNNAWQHASATLLSQRTPKGIWEGDLSASALATATAVTALDLVRKNAQRPGTGLPQLIQRGVQWLHDHRNADGGWGDTIQSRSNISTTTLVWAALTGPGRISEADNVISDAARWLQFKAGGIEPGQIASAVLERYGSDRTFSAPILTHCALTGRLGQGEESWREVIALPFELAAFPAEWFGALRLPVVSYALPALIAVGYARHYHAPSRNPVARLIRNLVSARVLKVLEAIQPGNGGFLEATPLTSFVVMSLAGSSKADHPVVKRGVEFLIDSAQPDGSWKIDTNLSTFVTTLAAHALTISQEQLLPKEQRTIQSWLLAQQYRTRHPYTNAAPGGWAWTPLPGGVPDADDTAGALVALHSLQKGGQNVSSAAADGVTWLVDLQNRDGGIPTFCRGWGKLPFDRSSADITAHALRGWGKWEETLPSKLKVRTRHAIARAVEYLRSNQEPEGSWAPLWFGSQYEPDEQNRIYGTSRVALALAETGAAPLSLEKAVGWLSAVQKPDGGWSGGAAPGRSSTEETALALECLCAAWVMRPDLRPRLEAAVCKGTGHLLDRVAHGTWKQPAAIGFYFAKLWYYERFYPIVFTVAALARARLCAREAC
jgi:squalene-hopene/tetraprenyl-beta-curcumene cyclase